MDAAFCAHQIVDQKEVGHDEGFSAVDDFKHLIEDPVFVQRRASRIAAREIVEKLHLAVRTRG